MQRLRSVLRDAAKTANDRFGSRREFLKSAGALSTTGILFGWRAGSSGHSIDDSNGVGTIQRQSEASDEATAATDSEPDRVADEASDTDGKSSTESDVETADESDPTTDGPEDDGESTDDEQRRDDDEHRGGEDDPEDDDGDGGNNGDDDGKEDEERRGGDDDPEDDDGGNNGDDDGKEDDGDDGEEDDGDETFGESPWPTTLSREPPTWDRWQTDDRYCSVSKPLLEATELTVGQQLRLQPDERDGGLPDGVYTIAAAHDDDENDPQIRLSEGGLDRIGAVDGVSGIATTQVVTNGHESRSAAQRDNELIEYVVGDERETTTIALAPHGGFIEYATDFQAERVADRLDCTGWICSGFNTGGGAFDRWHVSSTDIHERSFPALDTLLDREFEWGVAFHGHTDDTFVVGGLADESIRMAVRDAVDDRLPDDVPVALAENTDTEYEGASPDNVLNRLASEQTIQFEQPLDTREYHWEAVADAVADVIDDEQ